jgi:cobalt-zinc-cadmium efflux system protein
MAHVHTHHESESGKALALAFFINLTFTCIEIVGGLLTNSMAILSDALHDLGDSLSLGVSWFLERYSHKEKDSRYSYGYRRYSLLGAMLNLLVLVVGSVIILGQVIPRLFRPEPVNGTGMAGLAVVGIIANGIAVLRLRREGGLNARVMALHLLEDVLGWVAVLVVGIILLFWDVPILDPILSLVITGYVLFNVVKVLRRTLAVFLQAVPENIDVDEIEKQILLLDNVQSVHHTHVWSLDGVNHVLTTHIVVDDCSTRDTVMGIKSSIKSLTRNLRLEHTTVEIEYEQADCSMD